MMKLFCELRFSVIVLRELKIRFKLPNTATWWSYLDASK